MPQWAELNTTSRLCPSSVAHNPHGITMSSCVYFLQIYKPLCLPSFYLLSVNHWAKYDMIGRPWALKSDRAGLTSALSSLTMGYMVLHLCDFPNLSNRVWRTSSQTLLWTKWENACEEPNTMIGSSLSPSRRRTTCSPCPQGIRLLCKDGHHGLWSRTGHTEKLMRASHGAGNLLEDELINLKRYH